MSCILCFLEDDFQSRLRRNAQSKAERFENILNEYKALFVQELNALESPHECATHKAYPEKFLRWTQYIHETFLQANLELIFNEIRLAYLSYTQGGQVRAAKELFNLLEELDIAAADPKLNSTFYFRGRYAEKRLNLEEIYHLPFSLRSQAATTRFGITGQPLLNLSASVVCLISELGIELEKLDTLWIAPYTLKNHRELSVFNATNKLLALCRQVLVSISNGEKNYFGRHKKPQNSAHLIREFYRMIIASICAFEVENSESNLRAGPAEYVIPQLLTEILRAKKYDGILYTSTHINDQLCRSQENFPNSRYKENLVLFTAHQEDSDYDMNVLNKFIIFPPTSLSDALELEVKDLLEVRQDIIDLVNTGKVTGAELGIDKIPALDFLPQYRKLILDLDGNQCAYIDHAIGKLHLFLLFQTITHLRHILQNKSK